MGGWEGDFAAWAGDERARQAAAERAREGSLRRTLVADAALIGILRQAQERADPIAISLRAPLKVRGKLTGVGADFACVDHTTYVPLAAIAAVVGEPVGIPTPATPSDGPTFAATLARLAEDRPDVRITLDGGDVLTGELQAVGQDVLVLSTGYVAIAAVAALRVV